MQITKKGGPYNKAEQDQRRSKVYEMYFEKGLSALAIARQLGINRNTINQDIRLLSEKIALDFGRDNLSATVCRQIEHLNIQRSRLLDELDGQSDIGSKIKLEKILFDLDYKLAILLAKLSENINFGITTQSDGIIIKGQIQYNDKDSNIKLHVNDISLLSIDSDQTTAVIEGTTKDGNIVTLYLEDNGEPGKNDVLSIIIKDSDSVIYEKSGILEKGNIQIHKTSIQKDNSSKGVVLPFEKQNNLILALILISGQIDDKYRHLFFLVE